MTDYYEMREQLRLLRDEELISILREHNEEEWRPEVFGIVRAILKDRGVSPNFSPDEDEDVDETFGLDLVTIGRYTNHTEAEEDRVALAAKGMDAWIMESDEGLQPSVLLQVLPGNEAAAMKILVPEFGPNPDFAEVTPRPPCPECGSADVGETAEKSTFSRSPDSAPQYTWFYQCNSCGYQWAQPE